MKRDHKKHHFSFPVPAMVLIIAAILTTIAMFWYRLSEKPETIPIMSGTAVETSMTIIKGDSPGKTVMVVGGIHGDEIAGWQAGEKLKSVPPPKSGTLLILSPANSPGCRDNERNVEQYRDLNRSFPGEKNRDLTDQLAASIFQTIENYSPDMVVDLHEASREEGNRDFLGNSLIFSDTTGMEELVSTLVMETQDGTLCTQPFNYFGPAPNKSLNLEVTKRLGIPVITIETSEEDALEVRISNHVELVNRILRYYSVE